MTFGENKSADSASSGTRRNRPEYVVFYGGTEEEPGYGVKLQATNELLYTANFYRDTAERIAVLLALKPDRTWDELEKILPADGYDIKFVTLYTANKEVSPGRRHLVFATAPSAASSTVLLGAMKVDISTDEDGHLTVIVKGMDGSPAVEIDTEVGCAEGELGYRFTTQKIEQAYAALSNIGKG